MLRDLIFKCGNVLMHFFQLRIICNLYVYNLEKN